MLYFNLVFCLLFSLGLRAELPSLKTKQPLSMLRFISYDGKITYYQKSNGSLILSSNYSVQDILNLRANTHFSVNSTGLKKRVVIEADETYFDDMNFLKKNKVYVSNFGSGSAVQIGEGINAQLQLEEEWVSFFVPAEKTIHLVMAKTPSKNYQIKLNNPVNPYFVPKVYMLSDDLIFYTDINDKGEMAVQSYTTVDQQFKTIYKATQSATHLDLCYSQTELYIGEFGYIQSGRGSQIVKAEFSTIFTKPKFEIVYTSQQTDMGNMVCILDKIYFTKTVRELKELNYLTFEAATFNMKTKEVSIVTQLEHASQIINMDGRILIPLRGEYYVLYGDFNTTTIDEIHMKKKKRGEE